MRWGRPQYFIVELLISSHSLLTPNVVSTALRSSQINGNNTPVRLLNVEEGISWNVIFSNVATSYQRFVRSMIQWCLVSLIPLIHVVITAIRHLHSRWLACRSTDKINLKFGLHSV